MSLKFSTFYRYEIDSLRTSFCLWSCCRPHTYFAKPDVRFLYMRQWRGVWQLLHVHVMQITLHLRVEWGRSSIRRHQAIKCSQHTPQQLEKFFALWVWWCCCSRTSPLASYLFIPLQVTLNYKACISEVCSTCQHLWEIGKFESKSIFWWWCW